MKTIGVVAILLTLSAIAAAQAPPAVAKAFQQAYPGATVSATGEQRESNRTLFRVEGVYQGKRRIVLYDGNGNPIEVAEQVAEKELPAPVLAAIRAHRRAIYVSGLKVTRGIDVEYRLTVKGSRRTAMVAKPDGTVISFE